MELQVFRQVQIILNRIILETFLSNNFVLLNNGVAFVAAFVGTVYFSKFKKSEVKYFIYFLWYVALMQFFASYTGFVNEFEFLKPIKELIKGTRFEKNYWPFTLFWSIGAVVFYSFYFQRIINNAIQKQIVKIITILFVLSSMGYIMIWPDDLFNRAIPFIKIFGGIVILLSTVFYFMDILKSDSVLTFYKSINFFIAAVIFIWWLVTTPVVFFEIYFSASDWSFVFLRWQIFLFMNLFMYLAFAFAFITCNPKYDKL